MKDNKGGCLFCGQLYMLDEDELEEVVGGEGLSQEELLDHQATMQCKCSDARSYQYKIKTKERTKNNIEELFGIYHPEATKLLKAAVDVLVDDKITGLTLNLGMRTRVSMDKDKKGVIKVKRTITQEDTLES